MGNLGGYWIVRWIAHALILWFTVWLGRQIGLPIKIKGVADAFIVVFVLAFANAFAGFLVHTIFKIVNCLTLGGFGLLVNIIVLWGVTKAVSGFSLGDGFWEITLSGLYCVVMLSVLGGFANLIIKPRKKSEES